MSDCGNEKNSSKESDENGSSIGSFLNRCKIDLPRNDVVEEIEFERFFRLNLRYGDFARSIEGNKDYTHLLQKALKAPGKANREQLASLQGGSLDIGSLWLALYLPFSQQWKLEGYSQGRLVKSFSLGPGEEQTVELFTWDRFRSSYESSLSSDTEQTAESSGNRRDTSDVAHEVSRQMGFEMTTGGKVGFQVGVVNVDMNQGIATKLSVSDVERSTRNSITEATSKASNRVRTSRTLKITESHESGSEERVSRKLRNPNSCHTLNVAFFEILSNYCVKTFLQADDVRLVVLIPSSQLAGLPLFDRRIVRIHETALRLALLDRELEAGFAAARLLDARDRACNILCEGCTCGGKLPGSTDSPEWKALATAAESVASITQALRTTQILFPLSIPAAEAGTATGTTDIKRYLFKKSLEKNAPRLLVDIAGAGVTPPSPVTADQVNKIRTVIAALSPEKMAQLGFDQAVSDGVTGEIRNIFFVSLGGPFVDPISAAVIYGIASVRTDSLKSKVSDFKVYEDAGLLASIADFGTKYEAWRKVEEAARLADEKRAEEELAAKAEREIRILESFGLRDTADARERLEALLDHLNDARNIDHYRFAIWNERAGAADDVVMNLALAGFIDPTPVGIVGDKLAVPVKLIKGTPLADIFGNSMADLKEGLKTNEKKHLLPTAALYSESVLGQCGACEEFIVKSRAIELRQREALARQAELEADRFEARLKATPPELDSPTPNTDAVRIRLEAETAKP